MHDHAHHHSHHHEHHADEHGHDGGGDHHDHHHVDWQHYRRPMLYGLIALAFLWMTFLTVRETDFVLITRFGRPVYTITDAGLHVKWFFDSATYFDRRVRIYNPRPSEFLTRDKKNLVVDAYALWRIQKPEIFVQTVGDEVAAEMRLQDIAWSGLSATIGNLDLEQVISVSQQNVQVNQTLDDLTAKTNSAALQQYGIEVVDVRVRRLNLPEQNKQSVFARMRAERERIARQYRAEGEGQALSIRADADRQKEEILSAAYKEAEKIKGEGDAESTRIYSSAYSRNPRFYKLIRTLESYKKIFDDKTTAILSSDSELLRVLMRGENAQ